MIDILIMRAGRLKFPLLRHGHLRESRMRATLTPLSAFCSDIQKSRHASKRKQAATRRIRRLAYEGPIVYRFRVPARVTFIIG